MEKSSFRWRSRWSRAKTLFWNYRVQIRPRRAERGSDGGRIGRAVNAEGDATTGRKGGSERVNGGLGRGRIEGAEEARGSERRRMRCRSVRIFLRLLN